MKIGNVKIGPNYEPVIIAEIGINHNGSVEKAIKIADAAIKSGAKNCQTSNTYCFRRNVIRSKKN